MHAELDLDLISETMAVKSQDAAYIDFAEYQERLQRFPEANGTRCWGRLRDTLSPWTRHKSSLSWYIHLVCERFGGRACSRPGLDVGCRWWI